jgi:class 3 adenylate cyclase
VRIADAERDRAVAFLRHHCADGLITLDEFSDRVGLVFAASTTADIERVTNDLPALETATTAATTQARRRHPIRWTVSMFGSNQQKGRWRIEGETAAVSVMGGCQLDLRQAEVVGEEAVITAIAFMGGVDIIVPEGIEVVLEGFSLMGGSSRNIKPVPTLPGSPLIRVRAFAFMGGVTVRSRRPPGETARRKQERAIEPRARRDERARRRGPERDSRRGLDRVAPPNRPAPVPGIDAVAGDVRNEWPTLRSQVAPEGTVTILFSDIEGFTSMTEQLGDYRAQEILRDHYRLVRSELREHRGFEVKVHGDGFMLAFDSAARALRCASAIQRAQHLWTEKHMDTPVRVRMGLHTGEAIRDADDFLGSTVNVASRIATEADGGEILVSALLKELCTSSGEFTFDDGEEVELRGLSQPHRVFSVHWA